MIFTDDEKLMLFLIWCHCDKDFPLGVIENDFDRISLLREIACNGGFQKFLSEATQAKENFEFWVSDLGIVRIKERRPFAISSNETDLFKNKITITVG